MQEADDQDIEDLLRIYKISLQDLSKTERQISAHIRELRKKLKRKKQYNPDRNCGVRGLINLPCLRTVTCHLHKVAEKQEVPGRSDTIQALTKLHIRTRPKRKPKLSIPDNAGPVLLSPIKMILPKRKDDDAIATTSSQSDPEPSQVQPATKSSRTSRQLLRCSAAEKDTEETPRRSSRYSSQVQQLEKKMFRAKKDVQCPVCATEENLSSPILKQTLLSNNSKKSKNSSKVKSSYSILQKNNNSLELPAAASTSGTPQFTVVNQEADVQELQLPAVEVNLLDPILPLTDQEADLGELVCPATNKGTPVLNQDTKSQVPMLYPEGSVPNQVNIFPEDPMKNTASTKHVPQLLAPYNGTECINAYSELMNIDFNAFINYAIAQQESALREISSLNINALQNTATNALLPPMPPKDVSKSSASYEIPIDNFDPMKKQPSVPKPTADMDPMNDIPDLMDYCLIPPEATEIVDSLPECLISEITETIIASMEQNDANTVPSMDILKN